MKDVKVILADDHPLLLKGLEDHLRKLNYDIVACVNDGNSALKTIIDHEPDFAILDIEMPYFSGIEVTKACAKKDIDTHIVLLTFHKEPSYVARAKKLKMSGYLLKDDAITEIDSCIKTILKGERYFSPALKNESVEEVNESIQRLNELTPSQKKILSLVAEGLTTKDIADKLYISQRTVEKHRSNIISRLDINTDNTSLQQWIIKNKDLITF